MVRRCTLRALFSATSFFKRSGSMLSGGNLVDGQVEMKRNEAKIALVMKRKLR
jgi:hypothetical protein